MNGYLIDFRQKIGLIDIGVKLSAFPLSLPLTLKGSILDVPLPIMEETLDLLHVDDAIDLGGRELAESVLATWHDMFLVHLATVPVQRDVLFLCPFKQG